MSSVYGGRLSFAAAVTTYGQQGHLNIGFVRAAGQGSELKCLCSKVMCNWRGFAHLGVGCSVGEGKMDFQFSVLFVYMGVTGSYYRTLFTLYTKERNSSKSYN